MLFPATDDALFTIQEHIRFSDGHPTLVFL